MTDVRIVPASYKDPAGFVFRNRDGKIYRQINNCYSALYELLMKSGLYAELVKQEFLLPHTEIGHNLSGIEGHYKTLLPQQLPFISYPYEWSFDMLKDAALLTLNIHSIAIQHGMILKDATPYNIQFLNGKPVFIDTLSFDKYNNSEPWIAYRQFCEMFLYPLALSHYTGEDFQQLLQLYINGIPVQFAASLLPWRSRFNLHIQLHVFLQKKITSSNAGTSRNKNYVFNEKKMLHLTQGLQQAVKQFAYKPNLSIWGNYYNESIISKEYLNNKQTIVDLFLNSLHFTSVLDIGSNDGYFSLYAAGKNAGVIAIDNDSTCINRLYNYCKETGQNKITPLLISFINPSPAIGWAGTERLSFLQRARADVVFALAVIHHLAIGKNIPLSHIAALLSQMGKHVIAEFIPKEDEKVALLLRDKKDIFDDYSTESFKREILRYFTVENEQPIEGSNRILYLLKSKYFDSQKEINISKNHFE